MVRHRRIRLQLLLIAISFAVLSSITLGASVDDAGFPDLQALSVPEDSELERRHATIGKVVIRVDEVFESAAQFSGLYRLVDQLHIGTRERTIEDQLLFASGDAYTAHSLAETARVLRSRRYFKEATVVPVHYNDDNSVDVEVRVHDAWTLSPGISFGRKGGANSTRLKFEDTNFLGLGKSIALARGSNVDRTAWQLAYRDPNVFGSRWRFEAARGELSDGQETAVLLEMPFFSFDSKWSLGVSAGDSLTTVSKYNLGSIVDRFQMDQAGFDLHGGISEGWHDGWVTRYLAGFRYDERAFAALPDTLAPELVPTDRTLAYPWVGIEMIEDDYRSTRNLNQIGRIEDLYLGRSLRFELGYAAPTFGATIEALMVAGSAQAGFEVASDSFLTTRLDMKGRLEDGSVRNGLVELDTRYYHRQSPARVFFASLNTATASNLDPETQLLLGGDNGLRGYPLRYQSGSSRALVTVEERFYTRWQPLKLFDVGAAMFIDAGRTWGRERPDDESLGWLADIGVGLRLGSARSGRGNVVHIDVAYPLEGGSPQLLLETRASF